LLQYALPEALRHRVVDRLFARFVSADASTFAEELYLTKDQARTMIACGMHFGGHGDQHYWLSRIPAAQQGAEIDRATQMLLGIGMPRDRLTFCYPYGDYDAASVDLLAAKGYRAALTTKSGIADLARGSMLELPRLDTIDLPRVADAEVNGWTVWA
jgi:peptidoglycan/xylan/chitin deacetylase (PgdA/CDA1 family)